MRAIQLTLRDSLGQLIKIIREPQMVMVVDKLIDFSSSKDEELRDISGLGEHLTRLLFGVATNREQPSRRSLPNFPRRARLQRRPARSLRRSSCPSSETYVSVAIVCTIFG